jgi:hypothetical protein
MEKIEKTQPINRRARAYHQDSYERQVQVVEDLNAGRRQLVNRLAQLIWLMFGLLEAMIGLRVMLKLIAANPNNPFAQIVYIFTDLFLWPFSGLTIAPSFNGMVFEIPAIIALLDYALVGWLIVRVFGCFLQSCRERCVPSNVKMTVLDN